MRRGSRGGKFYCVDVINGSRTSLKTESKDDAEQVVWAKNQALRQPSLNLHIARAYLAGVDPASSTRTWQEALTMIIELKTGETKERWERAARGLAFDLIRNKPIIETQPMHLLSVLKAGTVSTNVFLRRLHNFCLDMNWLLAPIIPRKQWPPVRFGERRAITAEEHQKIMTRENNPQSKAFYAMLWHLGGAQTDVARLTAEDVDWADRTIAYCRGKTGITCLIHFGDQVAAILRWLPSIGFLFPRLAQMHEKHRATEFKLRCQSLRIVGITLHSYRYAWAERAKRAGYPERFAQESLGHDSKAVHRVYAKKAKMRIPALEDYERAGEGKVVAPISLGEHKAREFEGNKEIGFTEVQSQPLAPCLKVSAWNDYGGRAE